MHPRVGKLSNRQKTCVQNFTLVGTGFPDLEHVLVHHLLLVDEVGGLHDEAQQVADVVGPFVQHLERDLGLEPFH